MFHISLFCNLSHLELGRQIKSHLILDGFFAMLKTGFGFVTFFGLRFLLISEARNIIESQRWVAESSEWLK